MSNIYTFDELLNKNGAYIPDSNNNAYIILSNVFNIGTYVDVSSLQDYWTSGIGNDIFKNLWYRFKDCYCGAGQDIDEARKNFINSFFSIWNHYKDRYNLVLGLYKDNQNKLLDQLKNSSSTISRFNDTPQQGGDWKDDQYTTNITQSKIENLSDAGTVMSRISEIQESYENLLGEFVDKFTMLFISPLNFDDMEDTENE